MWGLWSGDLALGVTTFEKYGLVHYFYGFGYSVAIGAVLAGFASFIYEGASQVSRSTKRPTGILIIVELLVAAGIFTLYMLVDMDNTTTRNIIFYIISGIAIFIGLSEFLLRFFKKIKRSSKENVPIGAYIMLPIFIGVDLIRTANTVEIRNYAITGALVLACVVYLVLFLLAYSFAGETYQSRWSKGRDVDDDDDDDDDVSDED
ncbi:MAG: hypothetical protein ACTSQB_07755, partial [Candidatus Heimdallarchaeota archaeon]